MFNTYNNFLIIIQWLFLFQVSPFFQYIESTAFKGSITYSVKVGGTDKYKIETFKLLNGEQTTCYWGQYGYRQDDYGSVNEGSAIADFGSQTGYFLNHQDQTATIADFWSIDDLKENVRDLSLYTYQLTDLQTEEYVCGKRTKKYQLSSSRISPSAIAYVWITSDYTLTKRRFEFENMWKSVIAPLPIALGIREGLVLKVFVHEPDFEYQFEATSIKEELPALSYFRMPNGYDLVE
jgi:hypothetical protein